VRPQRLLPALVTRVAAGGVVDAAARREVVAVDKELPGLAVGAQGVDVGLGVDLVGGGDWCVESGKVFCLSFFFVFRGFFSS